MAKFLDKTGLDTFWAKIKSTFQTLGNLVTSWGSTPSDTKYPSEKLVKDSLDAKVSSITKNGTSLTPTNGVVDIGSMPVTRGETSGTVQEIIQAVRVKAGGSLGSVYVKASTVGRLSIPAKWYNFIWLPHQSGRDSGDNQHFGTLILTPLTESPDVFLIEGSGLNGSSPTYIAKRLAYYDHSHSNLVPEGDNRSVSTIPNDYSNTFVFRGIKNNSAIDRPSSDTYSYVIGLRGYQNSSGGRAHEIAFNDSGVFFRSGSTTSWTAWGKLVTDETLFLYANLGWGGKFRTSLSPVDVYLFYSQNAFFGLKPSAVNVEYSNDGGTTWVDYGLTDDQKRQLFSQYNGCTIYCGKAIHVHPGYTGTLGTYHDLSDENIADQRLRITLCCLSNAAAGTTDQTDKWIYCNLRRLAVYMSTQSASKGPTHFKITGRSKTDFVAGNDVWSDLGDYGILGDSGWNSVPCLNDKKEHRITFGNSYDANYTQLRFEIWSESLNTTPSSGQTGNLLIQKILGFSELLWQNNTTNSNMATYGAPYTVNPLNGVTNFGKGITSGVAIPIGSGGTGQTSATAAQYALLNPRCSELTAALEDGHRIMFASTLPSTSNGVFVGFRKASAVWTYIKGKISSVLGLSESNGVKTFTGNAATATKATQDSDGNAINATYFKSSGNTTLVAGAATKIGTQNGADVKLTLPAHQDISGKMNTSASNAASGALQNLTAQLTEGTSDFTDKTEIFTSYAGNNGFAESGHVNQPYRRKASSMLNYIESKRFYTRNPAQNDVGTGTKRIQLGYALKTGAGYCNYLVHVFFNSVAESLTGCGVTLLVNYDWNTTSQKAKCVILNDNGLRDAGYNIVLANFLSNDGTNQWMHITLGLVKNSEPGTLVAFTYSYCGIFRVNSDVNWVPSIASDTVGSYDQLVQAVLTDADTVDGYHIQFGSYSSRSDTISFY